MMGQCTESVSNRFKGLPNCNTSRMNADPMEPSKTMQNLQFNQSEKKCHVFRALEAEEKFKALKQTEHQTNNEQTNKTK